MKKLADITNLKCYSELKKLGFEKVKFTFQGIAYFVGAEKYGNPTITIEPNKTSKGITYTIRVSSTWHNGNVTDRAGGFYDVKPTKILEIVNKILKK